MGKVIDLTGKKFERLTVIERSYPNSKEAHARWLCKCDCGNERIIVGSFLRNGHTRSCGCIKKVLPSGLASMKKLIRTYKTNAKNRGIKYKLTDKKFIEITKKDCFYCGAKPKNKINNGWHNGEYIYNGIDRVDNTKGYTIDNIVSCCKICNLAKHTLPLQEFKDWIERVHNKMFRKEDQI